MGRGRAPKGEYAGKTEVMSAGYEGGPEESGGNKRSIIVTGG